MARLERLRETCGWRDVIAGQPQHAGFAVFMAAGTLAFLPELAEAPRLLGLGPRGWAEATIWLAVGHQALVALVFRAQLYMAAMTRLFGRHDMAVWRSVFLPLLVARPVGLALAGWHDPGTLPGPAWGVIALGAVLMLPPIWGMHSVLRHFTIARALGGDHFRESYAAMPLVREGAFALTPNVMYTVVPLALWGIALMLDSPLALLLAAFQHAYIWVHMYCTERPDMDRIYGPSAPL